MASPQDPGKTKHPSGATVAASEDHKSSVLRIHPRIIPGSPGPARLFFVELGIQRRYSALGFASGERSDSFFFWEVPVGAFLTRS